MCHCWLLLHRQFIDTHKQLKFIGLYKTGITTCQLDDESSASLRPNVIVCIICAQLTFLNIHLISVSAFFCEDLSYKHLKQQPFNSRLSGTTRVDRYQKKHSPAHTHPGQRTSFITFLHLQQSTASSLFSLRA